MDKAITVSHQSTARKRRNLWRASTHKLRQKLHKTVIRSGRLPKHDGHKADDTTCAAGTLFVVLSRLLQTTSLAIALFFRSWMQAGPKKANYRCRDVFPLPQIDVWPGSSFSSGLTPQICLGLSNLVVGALNCLHVGLKDHIPAGSVNTTPSAAQKSAHKHICKRVHRFLERLNGCCAEGLSWRGSFEETSESFPAYEKINSQAVDLPMAAATCDPCALISAELAAAVSEPGAIFPEASSSGLSSPPRVCKDDWSDYVDLTVRELQCGKLRLRTEVQGIGGVFAAAKTGGRQRKIWNGSDLSQCASRPPKPRRLANPSSFLDIEVEPGCSIFFSKRDASTFFDALQIPCCLDGWFAQPPISVQDLLKHGMTLEEVRTCARHGPETIMDKSTKFFPTHAVWPMGFSWSSAVAQDTTIATCLAAGIKEESIMSLDHPVPEHHDEVCFVATDDTVLVHKDKNKGARTLDRLDSAFHEHGIPRNIAKDVSLQPAVTALGCDLSSEPAVAEPAAARLTAAICKTLDVLHERRASPRALHSLLGVWQWFFLLQRSFFSIFDAVYSFVQGEQPDRVVPVPPAVLNELLVTVALAPLLTASLDRQPVPKLVAADAAPEFGFGVSVCQYTGPEATEVCRLAERRGDFVRLTVDPLDHTEVSRLGKPHRLRHTQRDFKTVICARAKWQAHSGVLEAHAYLLALKWASRCVSHHHCKVPFLIDAKVVIGAASKGRSSARALRTVLRAAAAVTLAADILPRLIYIPSESNPADKPSRGKRNFPHGARPVRKTTGKSRVVRRLEAHIGRVQRAWNIMKYW